MRASEGHVRGGCVGVSILALRSLPVMSSAIVNAGRRHFIFGYGSLISRESRNRTGETGEFLYATVRGPSAAVAGSQCFSLSRSSSVALGGPQLSCL